MRNMQPTGVATVGATPTGTSRLGLRRPRSLSPKSPTTVEARRPPLGAAEALERAREALRAREQSGGDVRDRTGRRRSPITLPEYRQGREAANKGQKYPAEVLTKDEVLALIDACPRGVVGARSRALFALLWRSGLRKAEALALMPKDIDLDRGLVTVLHGKGDRRRTVGIDAYAIGYLQAWLQVRIRAGVPEGAPLFCGMFHGAFGRPMLGSLVTAELKSAARKAGIAKRVHPHGLRHTLASELAFEGVPLVGIRQQLGHVNLQMTQRYIDHLAPVALVRAIQDRPSPVGACPPPVSAASTSQGIPPQLSEEPIPTLPDRLERPLAPTTVAPRAIVELLERNGRASAAQLSEALELPADRVSRECAELERAEVIRRGELRTSRGTVAFWQLARESSQPSQARDVAKGRIVKLLTEHGELSELQLAAALSIDRRGVARHCRELETRRVLLMRKQAGGGQPRNMWRLAPSHERERGQFEALARPLRRPARTGENARTRILELVSSNGGRATQRQLSQALKISAIEVQRDCEVLAAAGVLVRAGFARGGRGQATSVWALPPLARMLSMQPDSAGVEFSLRARRGRGADRILTAIIEADGRASQAQLAGAYGLATQTVAKHCRTLEARGLIHRDGLDKSTSNHGSTVWRIPSRDGYTARPAQRITFAGTSSSTLSGASRR